jgi:hypothetical protein
MGKGGTPQTEVTEYYMSEHFGVCIGPVDALRKVTIKEKVAWEGVQSDPGSFAISQPELFGGVKKEGGVGGVVVYMPGKADQLVPDAFATKLGRPDGASTPGFRGITSLLFTGQAIISALTGMWTVGGTISKLSLHGGRQDGFYWSANSPYLPGVWATVQRIFRRSDDTEQWYSEKAAILQGAFASDYSGKEVVINFWQQSLSQTPPDDYARMGIEFLDIDDNQLSMTWSTTPDNGGDRDLLVWVANSVSAVAPAGTVKARAWMEFDKHSRFMHNAYIDDIVATVDGEAFGPINGGAETGDMTGWTNYFSGAAVYTNDPHSGSYHFGSTTTGVNLNYQELSVSGLVYDMNPAHIIHECLTDATWGMGTPETALDDIAFRAAADTLYAERFGLSLLWTRQAKIEDFVQEILNHINGVLYVDPATGLLTLSLIRGDYDPDTLDELTPDNAVVTNFSRKLWGEITNEIIVTWTNPANEQEETITVQDDASIATQDGVVSDSRNYYGVRTAALAMDLAMRDLRSAGQPLASCTAEVDRSQWAIRPASVIKLTWPEYGLSQLVMRVLTVDYGKVGDPSIKLELIEDVFGLDVGTYDSPPATEWTDPSQAPTDPDEVEIFTLPLFFAAHTLVASYISNPTYPEVLAGVLTSTTNADVFEAQLWDEVTLSTGGTQWAGLGTLNIIGRATLAADLPAEATSAGVTFADLVGLTAPVTAGFVLIGEAGEEGNEIAQVTDDASGFDLARGVLDTVPRAWPAGTKVWFVDGSTLFEDSRVHSAGELLDVKVLTRSSLGQLPLASATLHSATLSDRPWLPNRPANVVAYGEAWSSAAAPIDALDRPNPWITTTWANRNRLEEDSQVLLWTDATVTPESGQTTTIEVRDGLTGDLLDTHAGLTGTSFDVPDSSFAAAGLVELRFLAERSDDDGDFVSLQYFSHWLLVNAALRSTEADELRLDEGGSGRLTED